VSGSVPTERSASRRHAKGVVGGRGVADGSVGGGNARGKRASVSAETRVSAETPRAVDEEIGELIELGDVRVVVFRRSLKNVHLTVHPPDGRVQITAPERHSLDALRAFAIGRLPWIRKQQQAMWAQPREPRRELLNRESHYLWGERYLLNVVEREAPPEVRLRPRELTLQVREGAGVNSREAVLARWYRDQLRERVAKLLEVWAPRVGEWPAQVHVQRMKTKWGSCHPGRRAIRLNTELAKKPPECLEYVLVHELVHLREANHGPRFQAILDEVMPMWREHRDALNDAPLAHVDWDY